MARHLNDRTFVVYIEMESASHSDTTMDYFPRKFVPPIVLIAIGLTMVGYSLGTSGFWTSSNPRTEKPAGLPQANVDYETSATDDFIFRKDVVNSRNTEIAPRKKQFRKLLADLDTPSVPPVTEGVGNKTPRRLHTTEHQSVRKLDGPDVASFELLAESDNENRHAEPASSPSDAETFDRLIENAFSEDQSPKPQSPKSSTNVAADSAPTDVNLASESDLDLSGPALVSAEPVEKTSANDQIHFLRVPDVKQAESEKAAENTPADLAWLRDSGHFADTQRSLQMVSQHANQQIRYGFDLAERGAVHSAEARFIEALSMIAFALDGTNTQVHSRALTAGLQALREADDFISHGMLFDAKQQWFQKVETHTTPVLKNANPSQLTPLVAMQQYYQFAQEQFSIAGGNEPIASEALYGLARIQLLLSSPGGGRNVMDGPKSIALHKSALMVSPANHRAANELGVLLARYGHLQESARVLAHGLSVQPHAEGWYNLAKVYEKLGDGEKSRWAHQQYQTLITARQRDRKDAASLGWDAETPLVQWTDRESFSQANAQDQFAIPNGEQSTQATATTTSKTQRNGHVPRKVSSLIPARFRIFAPRR